MQPVFTLKAGVHHVPFKIFFSVYKMHAPPLFTLRLPNTSHCPSLACVYDKRPYRVALPSVTLARHLQYNVNLAKPNVRLRIIDTIASIDINAAAYNNTKKRQEGTSGLEISGRDIDSSPRRKGRTHAHTHMNTCAVLAVDKRSAAQRSYQRHLADQLQYHSALEMLDAGPFLKGAFRGEYGIVVPRGIDHEDDELLLMPSCIIYPVHFLEDTRKRWRSREARKLQCIFFLS